MKQRFFFFAALCAAALVSCTPKEIVVDTPEENAPAVENLIPITITASLDGVKSDMDGAAWTWKSGDRLAVYDGTAKREFTLDPSADGQSVAIFSGSVSSTEGLKAVFPFEAAGAEFGTPAIPSDQSIPSGATIAPDAMIAVANTAEKVSDSEFNFYFTSGISLLRLTPPAGATKVIIHTAAKGETLAGESPAVTVNLADADGSKQFWAAVQPAKYTGIRIFTLKSDSKYYLLKTDAEIDLSTPGKGKKLGSLAAGTEVSVIEDGDGLVSYLSGSPVLDGYIVKDIDLSGKTITSCSSFSRLFDGQYHMIHNWVNGTNQGMFTANTGIIKRLIFADDCTITINSASASIAILVKNLQGGEVSEVINNADVTVRAPYLNGYKGVLVANQTKGKVLNCVNNGNVSFEGKRGSTTGVYYFGGIVGSASSTDSFIESCTNKGNIIFNITAEDVTDNMHIGGITGRASSQASLINCENNGNITVRTNGVYGSSGVGAGYLVAGITAYASDISGCVNTGDVSLFSESNDGAADGDVYMVGLAGISAYQGYTNYSCSNSGDITLRAGTFQGPGQSGGYDSTTKTMGTAVGGIVGFACGATVGSADNPCVNTGSISSTISKIELATNTAAYSNKIRHSAAGIVAASWGPIVKCTNDGPVNAVFTTSTGNSTNKAFDFQVGGIAGGCRSTTTDAQRNQCNITDCENTNKGTVNVDADCNYSNNSIGGIVGYPAYENASATNSVTRSINSADIILTGKSKTRLGGIAGTVVQCVECKNYGKVYYKGGLNTSSVGGIIGFQNYFGLNACESFGEVQSDVLLNTADGQAAGGVGGLVGAVGNTDQTYAGCKVDCKVSVPVDAAASMLFGVIGQNKSGGKKLEVGTTAAPILVKGSFNNTVLTVTNYENYIRRPDFSLVNTNITFNVDYGE